MFIMKRFLFLTDFSSASYNAFSYALEIATLLHAKLYVLHVGDHVTLLNEDNVLNDYNSYKNIICDGLLENKSSEFYRRLSNSKFNSENLFFYLSNGHLVPEIIQFTALNKTDLIILGLRTKSQDMFKVLSTNTLNILASTTIPLLCVPDSVSFKTIRNLVFSTTLASDEESALQHFIHYLQQLNATGTCLYVDNKTQDFITTLNTWHKKYEYAPLANVILKGNNAVQLVINYLKLAYADVIVTVKTNQTFFDQLFNANFTKEMLDEIDIPLLILPK